MGELEEKQLSQLVSTIDNKEIINEVRSIYEDNYPEFSFDDVEKCYNRIVTLFGGLFPGYKACNTDYHDLEHTNEVFLATMRLIDGYNKSNSDKVPLRMAYNLLYASLFHDTGYIQRSWDVKGTGAKYTATHVDRSLSFLGMHYFQFNIETKDMKRIGTFISATRGGIDEEDHIYSSDQERLGAALICTSDLIGQMANRAYLERLLFLYYEYREANISGFDTEFDILKKTSDFYRGVSRKLENSLLGVYKFAKDHFKHKYGINRNLYMDAVSGQMDYLDKVINDEKKNFRHKLNRKDLDVSGLHQKTQLH